MKRARETEREVFKVLKIVIANRQDKTGEQALQLS